jgi:hypothetical protein
VKVAQKRSRDIFAAVLGNENRGVVENIRRRNREKGERGGGRGGGGEKRREGESCSRTEQDRQTRQPDRLDRTPEKREWGVPIKPVQAVGLFARTVDNKFNYYYYYYYYISIATSCICGKAFPIGQSLNAYQLIT